jgi:putative ABC transport system substrate-binding protein
MNIGMRHETTARRKIFCFALCALLLALGLSADAQQAKKFPRIGYLAAIGDPYTPEPRFESFRQALRDLGNIEGKNVLIEYRYAEGKLDRVLSSVAEFVKLNVEVLVVGSHAAVLAAKQATKTIPIVMMTAQDPVATGIVDSLARPGGNITGLTTLTRDLSGKRLEL